MATLALLGFLAFIMEIIDSSLGMMYGTLLSPLLIGMGFKAGLVIPSILISQVIGGTIGTIRHHNYNSANFNGWTKDTKIVAAIVLPGILASFIGAYIAVSIPPWALKIYIGVLVIIIGILCLRSYSYKFAWWKMYGLGVIAAFNKALTGGGFGPVTSTGKIIGGVNPKLSIATTTYAEVPICMMSFLFWIILQGGIEIAFPLALCIGSALGAVIGPWITYKMKSNKLRSSVGILAIVSGVWCIVKLLI